MNLQFLIIAILIGILVAAIAIFIWARRCSVMANKNKATSGELWRRISAATRNSGQYRRQLERFGGAKSAEFAAVVSECSRTLDQVDDEVDTATEQLQQLLLEVPDEDGRFVRDGYERMVRVPIERRQLRRIGADMEGLEGLLEETETKIERLNTVDETIRDRAKNLNEETVAPLGEIVKAERESGVSVKMWEDQIKQVGNTLTNITSNANSAAPFSRLDALNGELEIARTTVSNLKSEIETSANDRQRLDTEQQRIEQILEPIQPRDEGDAFWKNAAAMHHHSRAVMDSYPGFRTSREWELGQEALTLGELLAKITQSLHRLAPTLGILERVRGHSRPETKQQIETLLDTYQRTFANCDREVRELPTLPGRDDSGVIARSLIQFQELQEEAEALESGYTTDLDKTEHAAQRLRNRARTKWLEFGQTINVLPEDPLAVQYERMEKRYTISKNSPIRLEAFLEDADAFLDECELHQQQVHDTRVWAQKQKHDIDQDCEFVTDLTNEFACFHKTAQVVQAYQEDYNRLLHELNDKRHGWLLDEFYEGASQLLDLITRIRETVDQVQNQRDQLVRIKEDIDYYRMEATSRAVGVVDSEPINYHVKEAQMAAEFDLAKKHLQDGRYFARKAYS